LFWGEIQKKEQIEEKGNGADDISWTKEKIEVRRQELTETNQTVERTRRRKGHCEKYVFTENSTRSGGKGMEESFEKKTGVGA